MILVTGGAGYIGSHVLVELLPVRECVVVDNFVNSSPVALERVKEITGKDFAFYNFDLCQKEPLREVFLKHKIETVVHMAGLKAVGESVQLPLKYYQNNLISTTTLLEVMAEFSVKQFIFSSSATVYGDVKEVPVTEEAPVSKCTNPYGTTKLVIEYILQDICISDPKFTVISLRYFNPIGAHPSGRIGEDPKGIPNNLVPFVSQVAAGRRESLSVFGNDFPTKDGTGVRDYLHVVDLARAHKAAVERVADFANFTPINLGTGNGFSVLEVVETMRKVSGQPIPYKVVARRAGDVAIVYASAARAADLLAWRANFGLEEALADAWRWQSSNPNGYSS